MHRATLLTLLFAASLGAEPLTIHVAPSGQDTASGVAVDQPVATLSHARDLARVAIASGEAAQRGGVRVLLRGGNYFLSEPLTLTPDDSGTPSAKVTWAAYQDETPIISGGVPIKGWTLDAKGRWQTILPDVANGHWDFTQLFVDDHRRLRSRFPKKGYAYIQAETASSGRGKGFDRFQFKAGDIDGGWKNLGDVEIYTFSPWLMPRQYIHAVDMEKHVVTLEGAEGRSSATARLKRGLRFLAENVAEALTEPGEFYLDHKTGLLTYIPQPGEDPSKSQVIAPRLEKLLILSGDASKGQFVHDLQFSKLVFEHTQWQLPRTGYDAPQAEIPIPGAIAGTGVRGCVFDHCAICRTGTYGIELATGCKENRIDNCVLSDLGAGGIKIGDPKVLDNDELVASGNTVRNCIIAHAGRVFPAGIGVWIGQSHHNTVEHCDMFDFYYSTLSSGWTWGYGKSIAHDNQFLDNNLHDIGQHVLSDMGAFYNLGYAPGTLVRGNRIDNVESYSYGGWGLYTDEGSDGVLMENNVVTHTKTGAFHQHYGKNNRITNNIFVDSREDQLKRSKAEAHLSFTLDHNIVLWETGILFHGLWDDANVKLSDNCYWHYGEPIDFGGGKTLEQWQKTGHDERSIVADPKLVVDHNDLVLPADSPAVKMLGIKPFNVHAAGLSSPLQIAAARLDGPFPSTFPIGVAEALPGPMPIDEGFEDSPIGSMAIGAVTNEDPKVKKATIRVSADLAASGKHSLKFVDAPGQKAAFYPFMYYEPGFTEGTLVGSFDLRMEAGAEFSHEWRTHGNPYEVGPRLHIRNGKLDIANHTPVEIPLSQWVHFEITAGVGKQADGKWNLVVKLPGGEQRFDALPCRGKFDALFWYGFTAAGDTDGVFYLDNVNLKAR